MYPYENMKIISKKKVFDKFFAVEELKLQFTENKEVVTRYYVDKVRGAGIVLINTDTNKVVLTRQFRVPLIDKEINELIEIPAGVVEPDEEPSTSIIREVEEETGYKLGTVRELYIFYTSPGYNNEEVILFYGEVNNKSKTGKGGGLESEQEKIELLELSPQECFSLMDNGKITDAKTLIALLWLKNQ
jgi:nudix-type nucleoside diphosphatase (YffH/AdpP family)